ncbi:E3 ubiquitin-protein ligase SGR9, amyloplastic [Punica granatum]|uniref:E3 ubiquitin-protein ligase SGR9, amyloplastic n=1 Tax=Punica granatum TaxID=22663 RepID=A0A218XCA8_PUNGR|nr:E3 ubiquitin-protein ligase SGR9, amyloplastic [Punica granatum]OWM82360.1 hypothetical protein CDL15_Pgr001934 [Punica granatum]
MDDETALIISALSGLPPPQLYALIQSIFSAAFHHHRRLSAILSSPTLFLLTLRHLHSLSLPGKTLLIARHLLSSLRLLTSHLDPVTHSSSHLLIRHRDLDAALLLLLLCDLRHHEPQALATRRPSDWRLVLQRQCSDDALSISGIGVYNGGTLIPYVETVARCWRFISSSAAGAGGKSGREAPASVAVVVALPSVGGAGGDCAICREEMRPGRDVCELPCQHRFHWLCALPWLRKRNTCPCCRFELPTDDVMAEIRRLWTILARAATGVPHQSPDSTWPHQSPDSTWPHQGSFAVVNDGVYGAMEGCDNDTCG